MTIKQQLLKLKENWLLIVLLIVGLLLVSGFPVGTVSNSLVKVAYDYDYVEEAYAPQYTAGRSTSSYYYDDEDGDIALEVEERVITKTASVSTEVKRGTFYDNENTVKSIITSSDAILLDENVYNYGTERKSYLSGSYTIKVDSTKYDSVISQLKNIGEISYVSQNMDDITQQYTDLSLEIETEKERLARYQNMYDEAEDINDKIDLSDRIFNLERSIKYMEKSLESMDNRVDYSTIYFNMQEKRSEYANVAFAKLSELIKSFVNSLNGLLNLIFVVIPYAVLAGLIWIVYKFTKKKKK